MGRYGGGKSLAAVWAAVQLVNMGKVAGIISNIPLNVGVPGLPVDERYVRDARNVAIIIDEAWVLMATGLWKESRDWFAFLRKRNQFLLLPSVLPLTGITRTFRAERKWAGSQLGIDMWWYNWTIDSGELSAKGTQRGSFFIRGPSRIYPLYNHGDEPGDFCHYDFTRPVTSEQ